MNGDSTLNNSTNLLIVRQLIMAKCDIENTGRTCAGIVINSKRNLKVERIARAPAETNSFRICASTGLYFMPMAVPSQWL